MPEPTRLPAWIGHRVVQALALVLVAFGVLNLWFRITGDAGWFRVAGAPVN